MTPSHHPSEAWLLDFTLGNLSSGFETVIKAHVGTCAECRKTVSLAESLGGEFVADFPTGEVAIESREIEDYLDVDPSMQSTMRHKAPVSRALETVAPESFEHFVETYLNSTIGQLRWRSLGKDLKVCRLANENNIRVWMLKAQAGTVLPTHSHLGAELTMVLKGAYFCGSQIFRAGDIEDADEDTTHRPVVTDGGECICLAVTEGELQFESWLPRLVQPLIGI